jgi:hypothetical protein
MHFSARSAPRRANSASNAGRRPDDGGPDATLGSPASRGPKPLERFTLTVQGETAPAGYLIVPFGVACWGGIASSPGAESSRPTVAAKARKRQETPRDCAGCNAAASALARLSVSTWPPMYPHAHDLGVSWWLGVSTFLSSSPRAASMRSCGRLLQVPRNRCLDVATSRHALRSAYGDEAKQITR